MNTYSLITTTSMKEALNTAASTQDAIGLMSVEKALADVTSTSNEKATNLSLIASQEVALVHKLGKNTFCWDADKGTPLQEEIIFSEREIFQSMLFLEMLYQLSPDTLLHTWKTTMSPSNTQDVLDLCGIRGAQNLSILLAKMGRKDMFFECLKNDLTAKAREQEII